MTVQNSSGGGAAQFIGAAGTRGVILAHPFAALIALGGSTFISGDSTPLPATVGMGIVMGTAGNTVGYISAVDYSTGGTPKTLLINNNGGRVGIGTNTPDQSLTVNGNASKPGGGSWLAFSDERLKNINGRFTKGLKAVMQLQPLRYEYKQDNALSIKSEGEHTGFSAQAVEKIIPEAVTKNDKGYLLVNNDPIMWTMLNAIKEQQAQIERQEHQIKQQQRQINGLRRIIVRSTYKRKFINKTR